MISYTNTPTTFNISLQKIAKKFVSDLILQPFIPSFSWELATLPIGDGGIGYYDPSSMAITAFLRPIL
jgi:hypothetical protein